MAFLHELKGLKKPQDYSSTQVESQGTTMSYGDSSFWEERYATDGSKGSIFEWLLTWNDMAELLIPELNRSGASAGNILHCGCGNSTLGTDLRLAGFGQASVLNTDISPTVIAQMRLRFPDCKYEVDDALDMIVARENGPFNAILDKGTLDAFACTDDIASKKKVIDQYLNQVLQVLRTDGIFIVISFGQPETRLKFFDKRWTLNGEVRRLGSNFLYVFSIAR
jgi:SAM-dependent methyltransferase